MKPKCVRCGACLAVCPVYNITRKECYAPRGKQTLLSAHLDGVSGFRGKMLPEARKLPVRTVETLKACLQCGACEAICPAGVKVNGLVRRARELCDGEGYGPSWIWEILRSRRLVPLMGKMLPLLPGSSGILWRLLGIAGSRANSDSTNRFVMPQPARRPALARRRIRRLSPSATSPPARRPRVAFFLGCIQNYLFPGIAESIVRWFNEDLIIPLNQGCCGMPAWSSGAAETALSLARHNLLIFEKVKPDYILTGCSSCAAMLRRSWSALFAEGSGEAETARAMSGKVREFSQLVVELSVMPEWKGSADRPCVTLHEPCHGQQYFAEHGAEALMEKLAGLIEFRAMRQGCCGQGGLFALAMPEMSGKIFEGRMQAWERSGAEIVITTCSGCLLQWKAGVAAADRPPQVMHPAELISLCETS